jgi:isopenicillin-N epimerase
MASPLKSQYLLDFSYTFLNHGSFGATPVPVFETFIDWQRELEREPVDFMIRRSASLLASARARLGSYLGSPHDNIVFIANSTTAFNLAARSLKLQPGDEILATSQEYPAMIQTWDYITHKTGARYVTCPLQLPYTTPEAFVKYFWSHVTDQTKVIFLSHIVFSMAVILPVKEICRRAREAGIITIIDGAHAASQIPVNLVDIGADVYFGACHKWLSAPKGSSYLYARPEAQAWLEPLVISHGWDNCSPAGDVPHFIDYIEYQGTRDLSAFLTVPAAIDFQAANHWDEQRLRCHALVSDTRRRINELTGFDPICP